MNVSIHQGSILDAKVDYIVNPANSHMRHAGGLARVIAKAAGEYSSPATRGGLGPSMEEMKAVGRWTKDHVDAPLIPTGGAHLTSAGLLPFKGVIHAVGPVWGGGRFHEAELLRKAHTTAFNIARYRMGSIAFPAISCGIFGYPVKDAAEVALRAVLAYRHAPLRSKAPLPDIQFWLLSDEDYGAYRETFEVLTERV